MKKYARKSKNKRDVRTSHFIKLNIMLKNFCMRKHLWFQARKSWINSDQSLIQCLRNKSQIQIAKLIMPISIHSQALQQRMNFSRVSWELSLERLSMVTRRHLRICLVEYLMTLERSPLTGCSSQGSLVREASCKDIINFN